MRVLLVGPYDPTCGEYTFLSPPLGVWRLAGVLAEDGIEVDVFDPNCVDGAPEVAFARMLTARWDVIGISTTGMTLRHDLSLAHQARQAAPGAVLVAGGMEATFDPEGVLARAPFDLVVLGEGERPMAELLLRMGSGASREGIPGTAWRDAEGRVQRRPQRALDGAELRAAILKTPYDRMPYRRYWARLEAAYRVNALPTKAQREARLSEIRSVRLITLNYCPMGCTFCSSTKFLTAAQGGTARLARLDAEHCLHMLRRIVGLYPDVRTIIFQDDILVFTADDRIVPLCEGIVAAKARGELPEGLQFIGTNRIDALDAERLRHMKAAGFRVLGFGIENFALPVLREFGKERIHPVIEPRLTEALALGMTPFLDLILTSPGARLEDVAENVRQAFRWIRAGCEVGMYPYVIPFSGSAMSVDPGLHPLTVFETRRVGGTDVSFDQPAKILPRDPVVRSAVLEIESAFGARLGALEATGAHLPSRVRSLIWILCAVPVLRRLGADVPAEEDVAGALRSRLPVEAATDLPQPGEPREQPSAA